VLLGTSSLSSMTGGEGEEAGKEAEVNRSVELAGAGSELSPPPGRSDDRGPPETTEGRTVELEGLGLLEEEES